MTWVAKAALSRELRVSVCELEALSLPAPVFVLAADVVFVDRAAADFVLEDSDSDSGSSSSLSATTVAGVHVDVDETAALTASTFACKEVI